jgi:hypothetical protein
MLGQRPNTKKGSSPSTEREMGTFYRLSLGGFWNKTTMTVFKKYRFTL